MPPEKFAIVIAPPSAASPPTTMASPTAEMVPVLRTPPENVSTVTDASDAMVPVAKPPTTMAGALLPAKIRPLLVMPPATVAKVTDVPEPVTMPPRKMPGASARGYRAVVPDPAGEHLQRHRTPLLAATANEDAGLPRRDRAAVAYAAAEAQ